MALILGIRIDTVLLTLRLRRKFWKMAPKWAWPLKRIFSRTKNRSAAPLRSFERATFLDIDTLHARLIICIDQDLARFQDESSLRFHWNPLSLLSIFLHEKLLSYRYAQFATIIFICNKLSSFEWAQPERALTHPSLSPSKFMLILAWFSKFAPQTEG